MHILFITLYTILFAISAAAWKCPLLTSSDTYLKRVPACCDERFSIGPGDFIGSGCFDALPLEALGFPGDGFGCYKGFTGEEKYAGCCVNVGNLVCSEFPWVGTGRKGRRELCIANNHL